MKKIKDIFSYSVSHGAVGLSCIHCKYYKFNKNLEKEDLKKRYCKLHKFSLNIIVGKNGFLCGEWFCKQFNNKDAHEIGMMEFNTIKNELEDNMLYKACEKEYLWMIPFNELYSN